MKHRSMKLTHFLEIDACPNISSFQKMFRFGTFLQKTWSYWEEEGQPGDSVPIGSNVWYILGCPPSQYASDHQDYETCLVRDPELNLHLPQLLEGGDNPRYDLPTFSSKPGSPPKKISPKCRTCEGTQISQNLLHVAHPQGLAVSFFAGQWDPQNKAQTSKQKSGYLGSRPALYPNQGHLDGYKQANIVFQKNQRLEWPPLICSKKHRRVISNTAFFC